MCPLSVDDAYKLRVNKKEEKAQEAQDLGRVSSGVRNRKTRKLRALSQVLNIPGLRKTGYEVHLWGLQREPSEEQDRDGSHFGRLSHMGICSQVSDRMVQIVNL